MGAISLYRGNLHRHSNLPSRWPMPPRAISITQFRHLLRKRNLAVSRSGNSNPKPSSIPTAEKNNPDEVPGVPSRSKEENGVELSLKEGEAAAGEDSKEVVDLSGGHEKEEVICSLDPTDEKEVMKREIEKKLGGLNEKKHYLVQMLKQILNAEEEIKRRSIQSAAARLSAAPQPEAPAHASFAAKNLSKISVDVSFGGDIGGETEVAANQTVQARQWAPMPTPSPSTTPISKTLRTPFHHSTVRSPHGAFPNQATTSSSLMAGLSTSPTCFVPAAVSISGTHFAAASSPSPAASGAAFSSFRDFRS